jgi:signal transduction histidine kinase
MIQRYIWILVFIHDQALLARPPGGHAPPTIQDSRWSLLVALFVPLVITAWQYDFKRVLTFCTATIVLEVPLILLAYGFEWSQGGEELLFILVVRVVLLTAVGYVVTRMIGAQRQQRQQLALANAKLRVHAATLEQLTISHERNRMARELHDTLAHSLSAVSVQLEAVDSALDSSPQDARRLLGKALAQTRSGLAETRRALQSLRASPLDDLGLKLAVENLAIATAKRSGVQLALQVEDIPDLPATVEQDIYRIAQEAITNVLKHAYASRLEVSLLRRNGDLRLTVHDDGVGFAPDAVAGNSHFGLQGMMERAELIGAKMNISSAPGQGTTIQMVKAVQ